MIRRLLSYIPHTRKLHLAVIGFPSSGKSYMLSDMIATLTEMGYVAELPSLSYPHSSLGAFFYDAYNNEKGGMKQTPPSACRPESHYGAVLSRSGSQQRVELDFLNIPGETFREPEIQLQRYYKLRKALSDVNEGLFELTKWTNPSGHEMLILEPAKFRRKQYSLPEYDALSKSNETHLSYFSTEHYMSWYSIYSLLNTDKYSLVTRKSVDGKYILNHFFEINTDSIFATFSDVWIGFASNLDYSEYISKNAFNDFYYMHYCSISTDIIICDKIFTPSSTVEGDGGGNFSLMTDMLNDLLKNKNHCAHVYLAFRGADLMMKKYADEYRSEMRDRNLNERRNECYRMFVDEITEYMKSGGTGNTAKLDVSPINFAVVTGGDVLSHIKSRIGGDNGHCFRQLLNTSYRYGYYRKKKQQILPPHVYFTATPIDSDFNFYDNDNADNTRFIRGKKVDKDSINMEKTWWAFHQEVTRGDKRQFCFGSYQLMLDIFNQNNIFIKR